MVAEEYEESISVNPPVKKHFATSKGNQTTRSIFRELLHAAGTDEQTVGNWYECTYVGSRFQKLKI